MNLSITELAKIRVAISKLLDELQLEAYVFDVEPKEELWQLTVDCAMDEG